MVGIFCANIPRKAKLGDGLEGGRGGSLMLNIGFFFFVNRQDGAVCLVLAQKEHIVSAACVQPFGLFAFVVVGAAQPLSTARTRLRSTSCMVRYNPQALAYCPHENA